jgi:hypothetical protein
MGFIPIFVLWLCVLFRSGAFLVSRSSLFRSLVSFKLPPLGASRACISVLLRSEHPSAIFFLSLRLQSSATQFLP